MHVYQIEIVKGELVKLKSDLDEANIAHEGTLAALRQKHNNSMAELGNQIDGINKNKAKSEKDKAGMERDLQVDTTKAPLKCSQNHSFCSFF